MLVIISQQEAQRLQKLVDSQQELITTQEKLLASYRSDEESYKAVIKLQDEIITLLKEGRSLQTETAATLLSEMLIAKAKAK